jgi:hypothetical protein
MHHLYLDPLLFACPSTDDGHEEFTSFLQGILLLRDLRQSNWCKVLISESTCDVLFQTGRYPMQNDLHDVLCAFGNNEIQAQDIIEVVNGLLQRLPTMEQYCGVDAVLFDGFVCDPSIDLSKRVLAFQEAIKNVLVFAVITGDLKSLPENKQISIARGVLRIPCKANVQAEVHDVDGVAALDLPYIVDGHCWICQNWDELHTCIKPEELWMSAPFGDAQEQARCLEGHNRVRQLPEDQRLQVRGQPGFAM